MELFGFGPHLMVDGHHANPARLGDPACLLAVLSELPAALGMTPLMAPLVWRQGGPGTSEDREDGEDGGLSGVVVVAESHVTLHTFPGRGFLSADVFSCREFDAGRVLDSLSAHFEPGRFETRLINRGKEFPKDAHEVERLVRGEREYLEARLG